MVDGLTSYFPNLPVLGALRLLCPQRGTWPAYGSKTADLDAIGKASKGRVASALHSLCMHGHSNQV